uniref:Uncharacterized protein n=1 Tax=Pithovirus LCPAC304 TaxID=2506594 RepID=A0A481ZBZ4_9VIRU|nr:MAG: hypothetical protein LCPAC304_05380 [Pithovirus LCPAC304]
MPKLQMRRQQMHCRRASYRSNRFFDRFAGEQPSEIIHITPTRPVSPVIEESAVQSILSTTPESHPSMALPRRHFPMPMAEWMEQLKLDIRTIVREELRAVHHEDSHEDSQTSVTTSPPRVLPRTEGDFVPFFNRKENVTDRCKTVLCENGYLHLRVELMNPHLEEDLFLYVFGTEVVILPDFKEHSLTLNVENERTITGILKQNEEGLYVIQFEEWSSFDERVFSLYFTFEGGLL